MVQTGRQQIYVCVFATDCMWCFYLSNKSFLKLDINVIYWLLLHKHPKHGAARCSTFKTVSLWSLFPSVFGFLTVDMRHENSSHLTSVWIQHRIPKPQVTQYFIIVLNWYTKLFYNLELLLPKLNLMFCSTAEIYYILTLLRTLKR